MMRFPHVICLCLALLLGTAPTRADRPDQTAPVVGIRQQPPRTFALTGARVVAKPGEVLENATIVIEGSRIIAVGMADSIPPAARVLDMSGKTIYAGFIDAYGEQELPAPAAGANYWNDHVTPQLRVVDHYDPNTKRNEQLRRQGIVACLMAPAKGLVKGISAVVATGTAPAVESIIRQEVGQHVRLSPQRGGGREARYPGSPMGAVALVRQVLYDADWYRRAQAWADEHPGEPRPETDLALEALVNHGLPLIVDGTDERYFARADRLGREFSLPVLIRGSGREYRRLDDIAASGRAILLPVNFPKAPDVSTAEATLSASLERLMHWNLAPDNPRRLHEAGVPFAFTTDGLKVTGQFLKHLGRVVKRGLPAQAALEALTTVPAQWLGVAPELGTIEVGKRASLVITNGPLFEKKSKVVETWVDGERFEHERFDLSDLRGTWSAVLTSKELGQVAGDLGLSGRPTKLKGQWIVGDKKYELKNLTWEDYRLTFTVDAELLARKGNAQMTFVVTGRDLTRDATLGTGTLPDGTRLTGRLLLVEPYQADEGTEEEAATDNGQKNGAKPPAAEGSSPAAQDAQEGPIQGNGPQDEVMEEQKPGDPDAEEDEEAGGIVAEDADEETLFDVNYPLGAYGRESLPTQPTLVALTSATVWTCAEAGKLHPATILIREGRIEQVGADIDIPDGAVIIDCQGKHITPGIIDCHSHIATDGGINESTQAITAEVRISDFIDGDDISIYRQLAGGVTSANVLHGSANPIGGQNQVIKLRWGASPEAMKFEQAPPGIKFALGENVKQSNWSSSRNRYPQTRMGVDEIMNDAFRRAKEYSDARAAAEAGERAPMRVDLELEALAEVLHGKRWIHCHSYRQSEILALMNTCQRFGVRIGTLQHILEGYKVADEMRKHQVMGSSFADWWAYKFEVYDAIPYSGALMHNAGVVVSFNSDDAEMGRRLNLEAAKAVKFGGVPPEEALKFVTANPARQLRIDKWVGTLEPGKQADIAVWSDNPLSVYAVCEQTWIDGRKYFDLAEDRELRARDRNRHATLVQHVIHSDAPQLKPGERDSAELEAWPRFDEFCRCRNARDGEE